MTTATWSTRVRHDSAATYIEWRDEFITKLGVMVAGGKLAADETNITGGAGTLPGANTEGGYAVYHISDSLHGTAPIYIRFGFGTAGATNTPRIQFTTGTSTNGSGVLGGTALATIAAFGPNSSNQTTDTARNSYMCAHAGFFGVGWKLGANYDGFFAINRSCDGTGAITATGAIVIWGNGASGNLTKSQGFRYAATAAAYTSKSNTTDTALGINPQLPASTLVGADIQAMLGWMAVPTVTPMFGVCGVLDGEVTTGTSFSTTLVGTSARTYIGLSPACGPFGPVSASATGGLKFAILWE